jgi:hypothetical protein
LGERAAALDERMEKLRAGEAALEKRRARLQAAMA